MRSKEALAFCGLNFIPREQFTLHERNLDQSFTNRQGCYKETGLFQRQESTQGSLTILAAPAICHTQAAAGASFGQGGCVHRTQTGNSSQSLRPHLQGRVLPTHPEGSCVTMSIVYAEFRVWVITTPLSMRSILLFHQVTGIGPRTDPREALLVTGLQVEQKPPPLSHSAPKSSQLVTHLQPTHPHTTNLDHDTSTWAHIWAGQGCACC